MCLHGDLSDSIMRYRPNMLGYRQQQRSVVIGLGACGESRDVIALIIVDGGV